VHSLYNIHAKVDNATTQHRYYNRLKVYDYQSKIYDSQQI